MSFFIFFFEFHFSVYGPTTCQSLIRLMPTPANITLPSRRLPHTHTFFARAHRGLGWFLSRKVLSFPLSDGPKWWVEEAEAEATPKKATVRKREPERMELQGFLGMSKLGTKGSKRTRRECRSWAFWTFHSTSSPEPHRRNAVVW